MMQFGAALLEPNYILTDDNVENVLALYLCSMRFVSVASHTDPLTRALGTDIFSAVSSVFVFARECVCSYSSGYCSNLLPSCVGQ